MGEADYAEERLTPQRYMMTAKKDPATEPAIPLETGDVVAVVPKNPFLSTTTWGVIITLVAGLLAKFGYKIDDALAADTAQVITTVVAFVAGPIMAMIGRWKATRPLGMGAAKKVATVG